MRGRPPTIALFLFIQLQAAAQAPPLRKADFALGGITQEMDSSTVRRTLGRPDSIDVDDNPFDTGAKLVTWRYRSLTVEFFSTDHVVGVSTTDRAVASPRGLRVGDSVTRLKQLYGEPTGSYEDVVDYEDPQSALHVLRVTIHNGRVAEIYLGSILD